jgi:hypothetical protein
MKKSFTLGAATGITTILVAVPLLAQVTGAQGTGTTSSATTSIGWSRPDPSTVEGIQQMIQRDSDFLTNIDAAITIQKSAIQTHKDALTAAASITDATQREAAVKAANEAMKKTIDDAITTNPNLKSVLHFGMRGGMGHGMRHGPGGLAAKLGMTETELKTALDSGKTIEQIAQEKGITLPAKPSFMGRMMQDSPAPAAQ